MQSETWLSILELPIITPVTSRDIFCSQRGVNSNCSNIFFYFHRRFSSSSFVKDSGKTGLDGRTEPKKVETLKIAINENKTCRVTGVRCLCVVVYVSMRRQLTMNRLIPLRPNKTTQNGHFKTTNRFPLTGIQFTALCWSTRWCFHGHAQTRSECHLRPVLKKGVFIQRRSENSNHSQNSRF